MANQLELYHKILFLDLRPWITSSETESYFKQQLINTEKEYFVYQPNYELDLLKPLNNFRKYYLMIIENESIKYLNDLHEEINKAGGESEKRYLVHMALTRSLFQLLQYTYNVLTERNYVSIQFEIPNASTEKTLANEAYAINCLKHQLIRLYLEIQDSYTSYIKEERLTEEELYFKFYNEEVPNPSKIIQAEKITLTKKQTTNQGPKKTKTFTAIRGDIQEPAKGIFTYEQIIKNPSRFAQIEEELFKSGFINDNYKINTTHGNLQYFAAFYHQLIRKSYFNPRLFPGNKVIKPLHIRKFLDHRYQANIDKQFRTWDIQQDKLLKFIEGDYWLDHIPAS
ncbi:MAG: hypothetical protein JXR34_14020 [Bacteroidales bacterium]|nr:hypothetical protein [Bacteroidales bacterium]